MLSQEVTALELITPLTWSFAEGWAHLAVPTTSALHTIGAKVTYRARNEVTQHCGHPAPRFLQAGEHFLVPYFRLQSLETGFLRKMCENSLFLLTTDVSICLDGTFTLELVKCCVFYRAKSQPLVTCKSCSSGSPPLQSIYFWIWFGHSVSSSCSKCTSPFLQ